MSRIKVLFIVLIVVMVLPVRIVMHLYKTQVVEHDYWLFLAEKQQRKTVNAYAERGLIKDRNGEILAYSKDQKSYYVDTRMLVKKVHKDSLIRTFSRVFNKSKSYYENLINSKKGNVLLEDNVSKEKEILLTDFYLDAVKKEEKHARIYPYNNIAAHVLGYVNNDFRGIEGLEKQFNKILQGENGKYMIERDVHGNFLTINEELSEKPKNGATITLTINLNYQKILDEELQKGIETFGGASATGIIMDPNTGEILAISNYPNFDPNTYSKFNNEQRKNRAITDPYEPGSTIKPIIMSILLEENKVKPTEFVNTFNGTYSTNGVKIRDTHEYGSLTVKDVVVNSSNIGMAVLSDRLKRDLFYKYLRDFGFGNQALTQLPGESGGLLKRPEKFDKLTQMFMSFGYEIMVTPIQLVSAYCALVNGGVLYKPQLVKQIKYYDNTVEEFKPVKLRQVISEKTSNIIKSFMLDVVERGTAKNAKLEAVKVGGKTGTTQRLENNSYSKSNYYTSFVGFFPYEAPKVVCYIMVSSPEKAKYGGSVAAPIFKNVADRLIEADVTLLPDFRVKPTEILTKEIKKQVKNSNSEVYGNYSKSENKVSKKSYNIKNGMPDLVNLSLREAVAILSDLNVKYKVIGKGKVVKQSITPGEKLSPNSVCVIECKSEKIGLNE